MGDGVDASDRLVKRAILCDILDNDQLKAIIAVVAKFIFEERAFGQ